MGRFLTLAILVVGCGDQASGVRIDAAVDAPPDVPAQLACTTGHEDKDQVRLRDVVWQ